MKWDKGMLIYNNNAGKGKTEKNLADCLMILAPNVKEFLLLQTTKPGDAAEFCRTRGEEMDVVFVLGGDGTVHECINGLSGLSKRPLLGILPAGTCNDFSRMMNIPQTVKKAAEYMLNGETTAIDVGKASDHYFLNFWGIGLITETSNNIDAAEKNTLGRISYFLSAFRTINESESFSFELEYDDGILTEEAIMILVMNGKYIGTSQVPLPYIEADDGLLDVVIVKNSTLALFKEILNVPKTLEEGGGRDSDLIYFQTKQLTIRTSEAMDIDTDGEIYLKTPAEITLLKQHIKMLGKLGPEIGM